MTYKEFIAVLRENDIDFRAENEGLAVVVRQATRLVIPEGEQGSAGKI